MVADIFGMDFIWVLVVVVVLFGGSQLPKLAKNDGEAMRELRKAHDEASDAAPAPAGQSYLPPSLVPEPPTAPPGPAPQASAPAPAPVVPCTPAPSPPVAGTPPVEPPADDVTLSRAELEALLVAARRKAAENPQQPEG